MSRRLLLAAAVAAPMLALSAAAPQAQSTETILPGYWEYTSQIRFGVSSSDTENRCVRPAEINGRMRFEGTCRDRRGREVGVVASGTYSPTAFQMEAELDTRVLGISIRPTGTIRARRLSATCPS